MKSYYYAGGTRIAMRTGSSTLNYLLGDHLGSQALTLTSAGVRLTTNTELRYYPYGVARYTAGTTPTSYNFTGQRKDSGSGLLFYNARWYDPQIGRFLSADTIVPSPGDPQSLNRYAYMLNNPLRYTDPSGHCVPGEPGCPYDEEGRPLTTRPPKASPKPRQHSAPILNQLDNGTGMMPYTSCGPTSLAMGIAYAYGQTLDPEDIANYAIQQGWYTPNQEPYISPADLLKLMQYLATKYGFPLPVSGSVSSGTVSAVLKSLLEDYGVVIVDVTTRFSTLNEGKETDPVAHFVLVTALNVNNTVIFNDPLGEDVNGVYGQRFSRPTAR